MESIIDYRKVEIERADRLVMKEVSFSVGEGEFCYLVGKVGSGKSSLLKTMYADVDIEHGEKAEVLGFDLLHLRRKQIPYLRRHIGIVFQDFQLLTDRTVYDNLEFVLRATGWKSKGEIKDKIEEVLNLVGMSNKGYKLPNELSGGEQQRIVIARAVLNSPEIILADEPTGNLDSKTSQDVLGLLKLTSQKFSQTIVMITHNEEIAQLADRIIRIEDGKIVSRDMM